MRRPAGAESVELLAKGSVYVVCTLQAYIRDRDRQLHSAHGQQLTAWAYIKCRESKANDSAVNACAAFCYKAGIGITWCATVHCAVCHANTCYLSFKIFLGKPLNGYGTFSEKAERLYQFLHNDKGVISCPSSCLSSWPNVK